MPVQRSPSIVSRVTTLIVKNYDCVLTGTGGKTPTPILPDLADVVRQVQVHMEACQYSLALDKIVQKILIPAGSYWIPMKQSRARLILSMLEPQAPDSLARWGLLNPVFGGGRGGVAAYLSEPIARRMMADFPELRKQFEEKLKSDASFAADANARLDWWFQQSKYEPEDSGRYPVVRVWTLPSAIASPAR